MKKYINVSLIEIILVLVGCVLLFAENPLGLIAGVVLFKWLNRKEYTEQ